MSTGIAKGITNCYDLRMKKTGRLKDAVVQIRVTKKQHKELKKAADKAGCTLTGWALMHLLKQAREES